ncbi:LysR family transcriptional regulator [Tsuneonella flava]|uniref:LysR family transcriptional regulator n=1 Tax=Tsuneonella flava TaxID=2055955 RepID=A0ABX7K7Z7_9SPHN|nr:LysR family transcriptional regulator [Tsuneonella flava]QSB44390.1 LysR family transcriptional regulator [Tsuneonella flava]
MDRIGLLNVFCHVVECGSFTRAADRLTMPRSSVSLAIQELERIVGTRLLHRTTRKVSPTQDGLECYERCQPLIEEFDDLSNMFTAAQRGLSGRIRVDLPGRVGRLIVAPAIGEFLVQHPEIDVIMGITDRSTDLIEEGVDCVLRVGTPENSFLVARQIGEVKLINVASPDYLARYGTPCIPANLSDHSMVLFASPNTGRVEHFEWVASGQLYTQPVRGRLTVNNAEAMIAACHAGLGIIQIPAYDVQDSIARGDLVEIMPEFRAESMPMNLLFPRRRERTRRVLIFADWLESLVRREILSTQ